MALSQGSELAEAPNRRARSRPLVRLAILPIDNCSTFISDFVLDHRALGHHILPQ